MKHLASSCVIKSVHTMGSISPFCKGTHLDDVTLEPKELGSILCNSQMLILLITASEQAYDMSGLDFTSSKFRFYCSLCFEVLLEIAS